MRLLRLFIPFFFFLVSFNAYSTDCFKLINNIFRAKRTKVIYPNENKYKSLGLEVEGVVDGKYSFFEIAASIENLLEKKFDEVRIIKLGFAEYGVQFKSFIETDWNMISILRDGSIKEGENQKGLEITSPIMRSTSDIKTHLKVIDHVKKEFNFNSVSSGGVHVHYGVQNVSLDTIINFKKFYYMMTQQIISAVGFHPDRELAGLGGLKNDIENLEDFRRIGVVKKIFEGFAQHNTLIKYSKEYETIENKIFNSTLDLTTLSHHLDQTVELFYTLTHEAEFLKTTTDAYNLNFLEK